MTDREKVINGLEYCDFGVSDTCYEKECPYYQSHDCTDELKNDILVLLKEHEPVKPIYEKFFDDRIMRCSDGYIVRYEYCPMCGQVVKQDG